MLERSKLMGALLMKSKLPLLAAAAALGALLAIPAAGAIRDFTEEGLRVANDFRGNGTFLLASDDDDDREHRAHRRSHDRDADDHDSDDEDDEGHGDDDGDHGGGANPAPAATVAPPANGLFGNGAAPKVQVN
jgi:hypothetical protein